MIMAPIIHKKNVILLKCGNVIENIQINMSWWVFFKKIKFIIIIILWFEILHKCEK
jgi:hypothetical protein